MLIVVSCFFFKQKTAYEMRISDWSSDVCSSDLYGLYRSVARPIERLSATVRATVPGNVVEATVDGPAEVVGLSRDFAALTQDVARQMSRREQAEQDVVESEQRYRRLFAGSPPALWV